MAIVGAAANIEHELANGYNSGDEYTGRTGNNLTLAEWQEVRPIECDSLNSAAWMPKYLTIEVYGAFCV